MAARKAYLVSPAEPSGSSWLLNCLLELDIRCAHKPAVDSIWRTSRPRPDPGHIWLADGAGHRLNPKAAILKKWLPALSRNERFQFRDDLEVEYLQEFPSASHGLHPTLLFVREPRDAMHSSYRRLGPELPFEEFTGFPNPRTLLDRPDHWCLFMMSWLERDGTKVYRFEDYKADSRILLARILRDLGIERGEDEIDHAVAESTFEKARAAEAAYQARASVGQRTINRAGHVDDWREREDMAIVFAEIAARCGDVAKRLGYRPETDRDAWFEGAAPLEFLAFFRTVVLSPSVQAGLPDAVEWEASVRKILDFTQRVDPALLERSRLAPVDVRTLIDSLDEFLDAHHAWCGSRLTDCRAHFADGAKEHFRRIRELRAQQATTRP